MKRLFKFKSIDDLPIKNNCEKKRKKRYLEGFCCFLCEVGISEWERKSSLPSKAKHPIFMKKIIDYMSTLEAYQHRPKSQ